MDLVHDLLPDLSRIGFAVDTGHGPGNVISHPDSGGVIPGISAEPGILAAVGGAGLACGGHVIVQGQAVTGAVADVYKRQLVQRISHRFR